MTYIRMSFAKWTCFGSFSFEYIDYFAARDAHNIPRVQVLIIIFTQLVSEVVNHIL